MPSSTLKYDRAFDGEELERGSVVAKNAITAADGQTWQVEHFNLDAIIAVGYRVNEHRLARQGLVELRRAVDVLNTRIALTVKQR